MPKVVFAQPFEVNEALARQLEGKVVVLDVAFCADTPRSTYVTTTLPFIQALGERLVFWIDHHEHERHAEFANDPRFILASRKEHLAVPEMITPGLVAQVGQVDTIVAHGDFDGVMAAAKWLLGGEEPYSGADADARAADSRIGTLSPLGQMIDYALKLDLTDDAFRHTLLRYLLSRCQDKEAEAEIRQRAEAYKSIAERTAYWAQRYVVEGADLPPRAGGLRRALAIVDIREETERIDLTELLLAGQRLAKVAIVRNRNLKTGEPQITIAAATDSGYNFVKLFGLKGGMPTRVTLPEERFWEAIAKLKGSQPSDAIEPPAFILYADVDRIKDYLFASVRLRHIVAASALLSHVNEKETVWLIQAHDGVVIFSAGGITEAVFKDKAKAHQAAEALRQLYVERTGSATVTVTVIPWKGGKNFVQVIEDAMQAMSRKKAGEEEQAGREREGMLAPLDEGAVMPFFSGSPFFRLCEMTGREFAIAYRPQPDGTFQNIGTTVLKAGEWAGRPHYQPIRLPSGKEVTPDPEAEDRLPVETRLRHQIAEGRGKCPEDFRFPQDFDELVIGAKLRGYIGYIEADGNRFGELLKALKEGVKGKSDSEQLQAYKAFSDLLKKTTQEALIEALVGVLEEREFAKQKRKEILPFRVLLLGGDDVLLVIQAQYALPFAEAFCRLFHEKAKEKLQQEPSLKEVPFPAFTMSAGVVIAHHNLPFLSLHRMASGLLKSAKRRSWQAKMQEKEMGAVDFQVVTGSNIEDLKTLRQEVYRVVDGSKELWMTGRPYLVSPEDSENELKALLEAVEALRDAKVPRSQLKQLGDILRLGWQRGNLAFAWWFLRLKELRLKKEAKEAVCKAMGGMAEGFIPPLWQRDNRIGGRGNWFCHFLWDTVELMDFPQQRGRQ